MAGQLSIQLPPYRVSSPVTVLAGPIAPWFGQPGQGIQYMLYSSVLTFIDSGFLTRVNISSLP